MAKLTALPSLEIIRGFKGIIDFYVHRGVPCARAWPRYMPARRTDASKAAATLFGAIITAYRLLAPDALAFFQEDSLDQPRTPRDIYVSAVLGHLHEASMSDFLTLLQESRDFLEDLTALLEALHSIGTDDVNVHVHESVLPPDASTAAHQGTQNANLILIANLQEALESVATDRLQVRGQDQLFSFTDVLQLHIDITTISDGDASRFTTDVPAGQLWIITNVLAYNSTTVCSRIDIYKKDNGTVYYLNKLLTPPALQGVSWQGLAFLNPGDSLRAGYYDCLTGDFIALDVLGYKMTLEP